jgi:hypothetical protein
MAKKGWRQGLGNGPCGDPPLPLVSPRQSTQAKAGNNLDFYGAISDGDSVGGQTTHAPAVVVRGGRCTYDQSNYPRDLQGGSRWAPRKDEY